MTRMGDVAAVGALADPLRRRLYAFVVERHREVSREEAAEGVEITLSKAKFHLDRLAEAGLLDVSFRRLSGRQGPGSGRPTKLYRRAGTEVAVSLPERRYDVMGGILASAVERTGQGEALEAAIRSAAYDAGAAQAADLIGDAAAEAAATVDDRLDALGYEPVRDGEVLRLRNCPFDALVQDHRDLVCATNREYVQGVLDGLGADELEAELDVRPGYCCVTARHPRPA